MEPYEVTAKVISVKGTCGGGHQVGDTVSFDGTRVDGKVCLITLCGMLPKVYAMRYGATFPWATDPDVTTHACPDADTPVVFELRRVPG